jgi:hypothetical protein
MGFVKGREDNSLGSHTQNNDMNLTLKCSLAEKVVYASTFQPIAKLAV